MSETRTGQDSLVDKSLEVNPQPKTADPLQDSLDELVRLADSLVDGLALEEPEESPQHAQEPTLQVEVSTQPTPECTDAPPPVDEPHEPAPEHAEHHAIPEPGDEMEPAPCSMRFDDPPEGAQPEGAQLEGAQPEGAQLEGAQPEGAQLEGAQPEGAQLEGVSQQSRREALRETLDALSELIDDPSPPLVSAAIQVGGDHGDDISACLDVVMGPVEGTVEAVETVEAKPTSSAIVEEQTTETEVAESPGTNAPPVAPADPSEETEVETAVAIGADAAVESNTFTLAETPKRSTGIWWLLAIVVVIAALATAYWVLNLPSTTLTPTMNAEVPVPDPPVVYTQRPRINDSVETTVPAEPSRSEPLAVSQPVTTKPVQETAPAAAPIHVAANASGPSEAVKPPVDSAPSIEPTSDPAPRDEPAAPEAEVPAVAEGGADSLPLAMIASRGKTTETEGSQPQAAGVVGISLAEIIDPPQPIAPEPVPTAPRMAQARSVTVEPVVDDPPVEVVAPADAAPVLIDRIEPVFDPRTLRRGESQRVILRVLVDERGRVVRVVVDQSVSASDAELAAINAVLRWTYEPALDAGEPVRSWTTESFEFTRQD